MSYPQIFKLKYSRKFLRFFYICCLITLLFIWLLVEMYVAMMLSILVLIYAYVISKKIKNIQHTIVLHKNSIVIDEKKLVVFNVVFSNTVWTSIKYRYKNSNNMNLLIFNDSCSKYSINHINKYLNFAINTL